MIKCFMYVLKFSLQKKCNDNNRGDSRLWLFISTNVQETNCVTIISVLIRQDTQAVRNIQQHKVGTRERTRASRVEGFESADYCAGPCFALGASFLCFSNMVMDSHSQFIFKPRLCLSCLDINVFRLLPDAAVNSRFSL